MFSGKRHSRAATIWAILTVIVFVGGVISFSIGGFFSRQPGDGAQGSNLGIPDKGGTGEWTEPFDVAFVGGESTRIAVGTQTGLKVSDNAGQSWRDQGGAVEGLDIMAVESLGYSDSAVLFAGGANFLGVIQSPDKGESWYRSLEGLPEENAWLISLSAWRVETAEGPATTVVAWGPNVGLYVSEDEATTWQPFSQQLPDDLYVFELERVPGPRERLLAATDAGLFQASGSEDGTWGAWKKSEVFEGIVAGLGRNPATGQLLAGTATGLFISDDGGDSWAQLETLNVGVKSVAVNPAQPDQLVVITSEDRVMISSDSGENWEVIH